MHRGQRVVVYYKNEYYVGTVVEFDLYTANVVLDGIRASFELPRDTVHELNNAEYAAYEANRYVDSVLDYAELQQGLDSMGASDLLGDLAMYAHACWDAHVESTPADTWAEFTETAIYKRYMGASD